MLTVLPTELAEMVLKPLGTRDLNSLRSTHPNLRDIVDSRRVRLEIRVISLPEMHYSITFFWRYDTKTLEFRERDCIRSDDAKVVGVAEKPPAELLQSISYILERASFIYVNTTITNRKYTTYSCFSIPRTKGTMMTEISENLDGQYNFRVRSDISCTDEYLKMLALTEGMKNIGVLRTATSVISKGIRDIVQLLLSESSVEYIDIHVKDADFRVFCQGRGNESIADAKDDEFYFIYSMQGRVVEMVVCTPENHVLINVRNGDWDVENDDSYRIIKR